MTLPVNSEKHYTQTEDEFIAKVNSDELAAKYLGRTESAISGRRSYLKNTGIAVVSNNNKLNFLQRKTIESYMAMLGGRLQLPDSRTGLIPIIKTNTPEVPKIKPRKNKTWHKWTTKYEFIALTNSPQVAIKLLKKEGFDVNYKSVSAKRTKLKKDNITAEMLKKKMIGESEVTFITPQPSSQPVFKNDLQEKLLAAKSVGAKKVTVGDFVIEF
jgi:hypothetical protein